MFSKFFVSLLAALALNAWAAVDVNRASQADLETVKGIGPGLSAKILKAREAGAFKDWSDMVGRVGGIGAGNAAKFSQAGLTVGGSPFDPARISVPAKAAKPAAATSPAPATAPTTKSGRKAE